MNDLLEQGVYKFTIDVCDCDYISKAGNRSLKLTLKIIKRGGDSYLVDEYLTKKLDPKTNKPYAFIMKKIEDLLGSIGRADLIGKQLRSDHLKGKEGYAEIRMENSKRDNGSNFPPSNKVFRFVPLNEIDKYNVLNDPSTLFMEAPKVDNSGRIHTPQPYVSEGSVSNINDSDIPF